MKTMLMVALLAFASISNAQTNRLSNDYDWAMVTIGKTYVQRETIALKAYGASLTTLQEALKKRGDLDTYLVVEAEAKRFVEAGTISTNVPTILTSAVVAYQKTVDVAAADRDKSIAALMKRYVVVLEGNITKMMQSGKMAEAKVVKVELDKVKAELAAPKYARFNTNIVIKTEAKPVMKMIPKEAKVFRGHHYLFVAEKLSWQDAKKACEEMCGHLVTITSKEENRFVLSLTGSIIVWLGVANEGGGWKWVTGEEVTYKNWGQGEPSGGLTSSGVSESRACWSWRKLGEWNDTNDDNNGHLAGYVCEWER